METVGVVLGGIPLVVVAVERWAKVTSALRDYKNHEQTLFRTQTRLDIQEYQYDETLERFGLQDLSLVEMETELRQKYPDKSAKVIRHIQNINAKSDAIAEKLNSKASGRHLKAELDKIVLSLDLQDGELNRLFSDLELSNSALQRCFAKMEVPSAATVENRAVKRLHAKFDADRCATVNQNARILHRVLQAGWGCQCPINHRGSLQLNWHSQKRLSVTEFEMALSYGSPSVSSQPEVWKRVSMSIEEPMVLSSTSASTVPVTAVPDTSRLRNNISKTLKRVRILEDMSTKSNSKPAVPKTTVIPSIPGLDVAARNITALCSELQGSGSVGTDLGRLEHPDPAYDRHVRVHTTSTKSTGSISWWVLTSKTKKAGLTRQRRFEVAMAVCWGVLLLADTDWLSEDLTEDEIQLMTDQCKAHTGDDLGAAYVNHCFKPRLTAVPPHLPEQNKVRSSIRNRTLFALGILLVELSLNREYPALRDALKGSDLSQTSTALTEDDIEECIEDVYNEAGNEYGYAVQRCLRCEFEGPDRLKNFQNTSFRTQFFETVVAPVQATYEICYPKS